LFGQFDCWFMIKYHTSKLTLLCREKILRIREAKRYEFSEFPIILILIKTCRCSDGHNFFSEVESIFYFIFITKALKNDMFPYINKFLFIFSCYIIGYC
jgi:hypothetical protein